MKLLDRYIGLSVAYSTFFVTLVLLALFTFFTFAGELNRVGKGDYQAVDALMFALLTIPALLYQLFPTAALIGTMSGLGILASNSELVAMRAAGYSLGRILRSVLGFSLLLMILVTFVGEYLAPPAQQYAETNRSFALSGNKVVQTRGGVWLRDGERYIQISQIAENGRLYDINVYELSDDLRLRQVEKIQSALNFEGSRWLLTGYDTLTLRDANVIIAQKNAVTTDSFVAPDVLSLIALKPESMSAQTALKYIDYMEENGVDASHYKQAFWMKVATPLATFVMVLLAIPIVLGSLRAMTAGHRILIGTLLGVGFYLLNQVLAYVGLAYEMPPVLVAFAPLVVFLGVALRMMKRIN